MKHLSKEKLKKVLLEKWMPITKTHHIPFSIQRTSDGSILLLNNDFTTYSFDWKFSDKLCCISRYTFERLFEDIRVNPGDFKVEGYAPINNLVDFPEQYFTKEFQKTK